jgi:hypothetical protein
MKIGYVWVPIESVAASASVVPSIVILKPSGVVRATTSVDI